MGADGGIGRRLWEVHKAGKLTSHGQLPHVHIHAQTTGIKLMCSGSGGAGFGSGKSYHGQTQTPERY